MSSKPEDLTAAMDAPAAYTLASRGCSRVLESLKRLASRANVELEQGLRAASAAHFERIPLAPPNGRRDAIRIGIGVTDKAAGEADFAALLERAQLERVDVLCLTGTFDDVRLAHEGLPRAPATLAAAPLLSEAEVHAEKPGPSSGARRITNPPAAPTAQDPHPIYDTARLGFAVLFANPYADGVCCLQVVAFNQCADKESRIDLLFVTDAETGGGDLAAACGDVSLCAANIVAVAGASGAHRVFAFGDEQTASLLKIGLNGLYVYQFPVTSHGNRVSTWRDHWPAELDVAIAKERTASWSTIRPRAE